MPFDAQLGWLTSRFYVQFELSPTSSVRVELFDIDKLGNPILSTGRTYKAKNIEKAMTLAYNKEMKREKINYLQKAKSRI